MLNSKNLSAIARRVECAEEPSHVSRYIFLCGERQGNAKEYGAVCIYHLNTDDIDLNWKFPRVLAGLEFFTHLMEELRTNFILW